MLFISRYPKFCVAGHQFVAGGPLPEALPLAECWQSQILSRAGVTEETWTLELGQFDTTANGWDEPTRIEVEETLRTTPDVLHVRFPGEMLCLGCDKWSQEDPVKVESRPAGIPGPVPPASQGVGLVCRPGLFIQERTD